MGGFFTFLIGFICFGGLLWLISALFSKASGMNVKNSGIVSGGSTFVTPNSLDDAADSLRKLVDKKYKIQKKIEEELHDELRKVIYPIDQRLKTISYMSSGDYTIPTYNFYLADELNPHQSEILRAIDCKSQFNPFREFSSGIRLTGEEYKKLKNLESELKAAKVVLLDEIKIKYEKELQRRLNNR